jgi:hypothetical protein
MAQDRRLMTSGVIMMVGGTPEDWGVIPTFLDHTDPRPAAEQFDAKYIGGWNPFEGFTFDVATSTLRYPGDPPMQPISAIKFGDELIILFPSAWVLILQFDLTWQISRMD